MLRCLIKLQVLTGQIGQQMTGTLSSYCRRIYFAAQEFSNWVTKQNSDITNVRYILFYDERIGAGVRGNITVHAIIRLRNWSDSIVVFHHPQSSRFNQSRKELAWCDHD